MSKFTVEINTLIQNNWNFELNEYPIFDESYREKLNNKILDHYKFYEIGFETPAKFTHYLKTTMNEIMPLYNQLYKSELISIDPLITFKTDKIQEANSTVVLDGDSTSSNTSEEINENKTVSSDTPNGSIANIEDEGYATEFSKDNVTNNRTDTLINTNDATTTNNQAGEEHTSGFNIPLSDLIIKYRETFLNIDMKIINDLSELFLGIY